MRIKTIGSLALVIASWFSVLAANGQSLPNLFPFPNATGVLETYNAGGTPIQLTGPFFLGTQGKSNHPPKPFCSICSEAAFYEKHC